MEQDIEQIQTVPYVAYESALFYADKRHKRLWIITFILFLIVIGRTICTEVLSRKQLNN